MKDKRFSERREEYMEISGDAKGQGQRAKVISHWRTRGQRRHLTDQRGDFWRKVTNGEIWVRISKDIEVKLQSREVNSLGDSEKHWQGVQTEEGQGARSAPLEVTRGRQERWLRRDRRAVFTAASGGECGC